MPPRKAAAAAKPAPKANAPVKSTTSSAKATSTAADTKPLTKRKASEVVDKATKPAPKRTKTKAASEAPTLAPAKAQTTKAAPEKKAAAPKKAAVAKAAPKVTKKATVTKEAAIQDVESANETETETKPAPKKAAAPKKAVAPKLQKPLPEINFAPTQKLQIYVFGEGSAGELGLGAKSADGKKVVDVTRPRLNDRLEPLGIVQIAVGGMHCAALTADNRIFTWGVNDQGALGRETTQEGKMKDITADDEDSDSDEEGSGLNPSEAEPREVDSKHFPEGTKFAALFAGDSTTFALTTTGLVYGWGTFRGNDGVLGFTKSVKQQMTPTLIPELKQIKNLATGVNHVLALNQKGRVFAWGAGEQSQLARRVVARTAIGALVPREFGLQRKTIVNIGCGDYHSFAVDKNGDVFAWGLNTFGQTGIVKDDDEDDTVHAPTVIENLKGKDIKQITGGAHHTLSCTKDGEVLLWGRVDNNQGGMDVDEMPKDSIYFDPINKRARYLEKPLTIPDIKGAFIATASDTCFVISEDGKAYSWGFSTNYQTAQGTDEDVIEASVVENSAVRGKKLVFAGVGGQFGVLGGVSTEMTNGV